MISNSFIQKIFLTMFFGMCAAGLLQFYKHMVWKANEEINGAAALQELYGTHYQVAHPSRHSK